MNCRENFENLYVIDEPSEHPFTDGKSLKPGLCQKILYAEEKLFQEIEAVFKSISEYDDYSVYKGYSGIAMLYLLKYNITLDESYLMKGKELIDKALGQMTYNDIGFLQGDAGPLAIGAVIYSKMRLIPKRNILITRLLRLPNVLKHQQCDLLSGYAGYLYALLYLRKEIGPVIPDDAVRNAVETILEAGQRKAKDDDASVPLVFKKYGQVVIGTGNGLSGILYILLCANEFLTDIERHEIVKPTIDWLSEQRHRNGNFRKSVGHKKDKYVQWCNGAPGVTSLFLLASQVYSSQKYLDIALEAGEVTWERGLVRNAHSLLKGISGNAYTFIHLFNVTNDGAHLVKAACFTDWCTKYIDKERERTGSQYSLFEGITGIVYFLNDVQNPPTSAFPGFYIT